MEPHHLFPLQDSRLVRHDAGLVEARLPVEQQRVAILEMSVDNLGSAEAKGALITWCEKGLCDSFPLGPVGGLEHSLPPELVLHHHSPGMDIRAIEHQLPQL